MYSLISFATQWGSKHGGINSFNADLLSAFAVAYHLNAQVICVVASATPEQKEEAAKANVRIVPLPYPPDSSTFNSAHGGSGVEQLRQMNIGFEPDTTFWLGHDRITGEAAIAAVKKAGGRSAVIHHMSYDHYEPYAEGSVSAQQKTQQQAAIFQEADLVLAVGPLLLDAAKDLLGGSKSVYMVVPGLAEIDTKPAPKNFTAFLSGRLTADAARIKQGQLGIAAFATAQREARDANRPESLRRQPKLLLRGLDFDDRLTAPLAKSTHDPEVELRKFAENYAHAVINLHALPFTEDRTQLYSELSKASVALMPSWHEGFGLVAWEAIAAGVPLIIGVNSGVYRLLDEVFAGPATGSVYSIEVDGTNDEPFFSDQDLNATVEAIKAVADNPNKARMQANALRSMLLENYTWPSCAEQLAAAFSWQLSKGSIPVDGGRRSSSLANVQPATLPPLDEADPLRIPVARWRPGAGMAESQLLRAEEALLPFDSARDSEVERLNAWLDDPKWPLAIRLITGAGGQGKTRLALELCQQRGIKNWHTGFLDSKLEAMGMRAAWRTLWDYQKSLLIVIDYVETRQTDFLALLKAALSTLACCPVRILLLARDGGEWWDNLPSKDPECEALLSGYATTGPFRLSPLYRAEEGRREAYRKSVLAFARILDVEPPTVEPDLTADHFERPLYVQMAALIALYGEQPLTSQGLTRALLNHERRYWMGLLAHFNWPEPDRRAEQLLALTTLSGGFATPRAAESYWLEAKGNVINTGEFNSLFRELATLYPGSQGLQPLRPDLLGEALVAQALLRPQGVTLLDSVLSSSATHQIRRNALTVIARLSKQRLDLYEFFVEALARHLVHSCTDIVAVSTETASHLPELAESAFAGLPTTIKSQAAGLLDPLFETESVHLAEWSRVVFEYLVEKSRLRWEKKPRNPGRMIEYAQKLTNYALALYRVGRSHQALDVGLRGLEVYRRLPVKDLKRIQLDYATSLSNVAIHLSKVGKSEEALAYAREAVEIHRELAQKNHDAYDPNYAISLNNYANRLNEAGRYQDALEHAHKATDIYKRLVNKNPGQFESDYAACLTTHANQLSEVGKHDEAVVQGRTAVDIRRPLAEKKPDSFEPDLATSLINHANHLSEIGQHEEALQHIREAVNVLRRVAEKNPDRYEPDLATSISNYASHLSDTGQYNEALERSQEALEIRLRLAEKNSEQFEPHLPKALDHYANRLSDLGQNHKALEHSLHALEISQRLAGQNSDRFEPELADSLSNYARHLSDSGQSKEALGFAHQALNIQKRLIDKDPDRFEPDLAMSLANYSERLSDAGQYETALKPAREALEIGKRLAEKNPDRFQDVLAMSFITCENRLSEIGHYQDALEYARQALKIHKRLAEKSPRRFAEEIFSNMCFASFLTWIVSGEDNNELQRLGELLTLIPSEGQHLMLLYSAFVQACWETEPVLRGNLFQKVVFAGIDLSAKDKKQAKPYWLCGAAWCAKFSPDVVVGIDWEALWRQYARARDGHTPQWMFSVAQRLQFEWPC